MTRWVVVVVLTALAEWDVVAELLDVEVVFGGVVVVVVEVLFGGVVVVVVVDLVCATSGDAATRVASVAMRSFIRILLLMRRFGEPATQQYACRAHRLHCCLFTREKTDSNTPTG